MSFSKMSRSRTGTPRKHEHVLDYMISKTGEFISSEEIDTMKLFRKQENTRVSIQLGVIRHGSLFAKLEKLNLSEEEKKKLRKEFYKNVYELQKSREDLNVLNSRMICRFITILTEKYLSFRPFYLQQILVTKNLLKQSKVSQKTKLVLTIMNIKLK